MAIISLKNFVDFMTENKINNEIKSDIIILFKKYLKRPIKFYANKNSSNLKNYYIKILLDNIINDNNMTYSKLIGLLVLYQKRVHDLSLFHKNIFYKKPSQKKFDNIIRMTFDIIAKGNTLSKLLVPQTLNKSLLINKESIEILDQITQNGRFFKIYKLFLLITSTNTSQTVQRSSNNKGKINYLNYNIEIDKEYIGKNVTIFHYPESKSIVVSYQDKYLTKFIYQNNIRINHVKLEYLTDKINLNLIYFYYLEKKVNASENIFLSNLGISVLNKFLENISSNLNKDFLKKLYQFLDILDYDILECSENLLNFFIVSSQRSIQDPYLRSISYWLVSLKEDNSKTKRYRMILEEKGKFINNIYDFIENFLKIIESSLGESFFSIMQNSFELMLNKTSLYISSQNQIAIKNQSLNVAKYIYQNRSYFSHLIHPVSIATIFAHDFVSSSYQCIKDVILSNLNLIYYFVEWFGNPIYFNNVEEIESDVFYDAIEHFEFD